MTINQTTTLKDTMFPVKEVPAICNQPLNNEEVIPSGYKFIMREDTNKVLSCMTDEYKLVPNKKIFDYANPIIKKNGGVLKEATLFGDGARTTVKWHFPKVKVSVNKGDEMTPEIVIRNSYDGSLGVNILAGAFRLVCSNGMVIGVVAQNYKNKHSVYNVSLNDIESVIDETIDKTKIIFKDEFPILVENQIKEKHIVNLIKMFPIQANEIITQRLIADKPRTFWDLFNVGTNVLTHNMNRNSEATHTLENNIYKAVKGWALKEIPSA